MARAAESATGAVPRSMCPPMAASSRRPLRSCGGNRSRCSAARDACGSPEPDHSMVGEGAQHLFERSEPGLEIPPLIDALAAHRPAHLLSGHRVDTPLGLPVL